MLLRARWRSVGGFSAGEAVVERGGGGLKARVLSGGLDWYGAKFILLSLCCRCSRLRLCGTFSVGRRDSGGFRQDDVSQWYGDVGGAGGGACRGRSEIGDWAGLAGDFDSCFTPSLPYQDIQSTPS